MDQDCTTLEQTALIWNRSNHGYNCYWKFPDDDNPPRAEEDVLCKVSRKTFNSRVATLTEELRDVIVKCLEHNLCCTSIESGDLRSVPIAVAIPEGPFLPLAIVAVHTLNTPFPLSSQMTASAVLLPLDPSDGRLRLLHMLEETRPVLILTASDDDYDRMRDVTAQMKTPTCCAVTEVLYQATHSRVIDLRGLVQNALERFTHNETCCPTQLGIPNYENETTRRLSHIVFTSGSTGLPKACLSSNISLRNYLAAKNRAHEITNSSTVLLASALTFDPCLSDILATLLLARGTLALAPRSELVQNLGNILCTLQVTHVLCTPTLWSTVQPCIERSDEGFPHLRVVSLGGEHIPKHLIRAWARPSTNADSCSSALRLCATFGVTEACVYQTFGEVAVDSISTMGQNVGLPFPGMHVRICDESRQDELLDVELTGYSSGVGEVVLHGNQLDNYSSYLMRPELSSQKFVAQNGTMYYRTGDRGYFHQESSQLHILGRIAGEVGMVKVNGVRVELGEIEAALIDESDEYSLVTGAIAVAANGENAAESTSFTELHAFVVLCKTSLAELKISDEVPVSGLLCSESPLLVLLRERCKLRVKVIPSAFVVIPRIPLSPTGKCDRNGVPTIDEAIPLASFAGSNHGVAALVPLSEYGQNGFMVSSEIATCLNLRPSQQALMTTQSSFAMLGGDSLAATRIVRAIYARHHDVVNNRFIGGEHGILSGPFAAVHLLSAATLGSYVDWLDSHGVCMTQASSDKLPSSESVHSANETKVSYFPDVSPEKTEAENLSDALLQATSSRSETVAMALLDVGADPNLGESKGRIGKTSGRLERMKLFRSSPLHVACLHAMPRLVKKLLEHKAKYNTPNASSLFPIHLAASGEFLETMIDEEDDRRLLCVKYLLEAGAPLTMRDGSKQTILHAAARSGHVKVLRFALEEWIRQSNPGIGNKSTNLDWRDNWSRTPVHWAVLNGKVCALEVLIEMGCSANPIKPKESQRRTSAAAESPMEICDRLYDEHSELGRRIRTILQEGSFRYESTTHS